jgi:pyridoxine kinase
MGIRCASATSFEGMMAKVLAISSHVVRGHVGLDATVPALQHLGHEVWALPTVLLASRPGMGRLERQDITGPALARMLAALEADGCWTRIGAVFTGYFPSPESVAAVAQAIAAIKQVNPDVTVLVDPILGDGGRLYVGEATASAIRDALLPLATVATPNLFELGWLTGAVPVRAEEVARAARRIGPPLVVVTSAAETEAAVATLLVGPEHVLLREVPRHPSIPNGVGDHFAGLLLGNLLNGLADQDALDASLAILERVLAASVGRDVLQLVALGGLRR